MNPDRVLLVVVFDYINEKNENETFKIRIREGDLPKGAEAVSGAQLHAILLDRCDEGLDATTIDIYNTKSESFETLDLNEMDIASRFGRCIRCTLPCNASSSSSTPAIMGRFFPYDSEAGLEVAGTTIHIKETPNASGDGTGLSVWDGSMLLYVIQYE